MGHIQFYHEIWPSDPRDQRQSASSASFTKYTTQRWCPVADVTLLNINMLEHFVERVEFSVRAAVNPQITAEKHIF